MPIKKWEHSITLHDAGLFRVADQKDPNDRVFQCGVTGTCLIENVGEVVVGKMAELLDERGREGWELVQLEFMPSGMVCFWKRPIE